MKLGEGEEIEICSSFLFDETRPELLKQFGKERVHVSVISGKAQDNVETADLDEISNLGYKPLIDRDEKRARSFCHMLRWVKSDPDRLSVAKTVWHGLKRYMRLVGARSGS